MLVRKKKTLTHKIESRVSIVLYHQYKYCTLVPPVLVLHSSTTSTSIALQYHQYKYCTPVPPVLVLH